MTNFLIMKLLNFIIFLAVFLTVYGLANYYIYYRGAELFDRKSAASHVFTAVFLFVSLSYIVGRFLEKAAICAFSSVLIWIGSLWMAFMVYLMLPLFAVDIIRFGDRFLHYIPGGFHGSILARKIAGSAVILVSCAAVVFGYFNASHPRIRTVDIAVKGKKPRIGSLNIVMVSDIHLGVIISNSRLTKMVEKINGLEPDIVLLAGDVVDEDLAPVIQNNLGETLRNIRSRYGVFGITGNHEFIGGVEPAVRYLSDHGITMLRDEWIVVANAFTIVGREDRSGRYFNGKERKALAAILQGVRRDLPIIMMDHQPFDLEDAVDNGIDVQLSGHTHHGQMWPFNHITSMIYRISRGYARIGDSHFYVSAGYGTWGPPVRTGSVPEIVNIRLVFER